jgi:hypothetical protein
MVCATLSQTANRETTGMLVGGVITGLACLVFVILLLADKLDPGIDRMSSRYAMLLAIFIAIIGGVVTCVYAWRASCVKRILNGEGRLSHWTYPAWRYEQELEKNYRCEISEKGKLFMITTMVVMVVGGIMFVVAYINEDFHTAWASLGFLGIIPVSAFFAFGLPWLHYRFRRRPMEVIIAWDGLMFYGDFHPLLSGSQAVKRVELKESEIVFSIRYLIRLSRSYRPVYTVSVPVPEGKLKTADEIVRRFQKILG